jgi:hypothetical protein
MKFKLFACTTVVWSAMLGTGCSSTPMATEKELDSSSETGKPSDAAGKDSGVSGETGPGSDAGDSGTEPSLHWYTTCGYPVCGEPMDAGPDASASPDASVTCPAVGSACSSRGDTCGKATAANCGVTLLCDDHDPRGAHGDMCPISSRTFKDGVQYVSDAELSALHDEALGIKLATYRYKAQVGDPDPKHLGFIIEDNSKSLAVDQAHNRVDLYGYVSMVVAAMQVQEKEIASLRQELAEARQDICLKSTK